METILYIALLSAIGYILGYYFKILISKVSFKRKCKVMPINSFISNETIIQIEEYRLELRKLANKYKELK